MSQLSAAACEAPDACISNVLAAAEGQAPQLWGGGSQRCQGAVPDVQDPVELQRPQRRQPRHQPHDRSLGQPGIRGPGVIILLGSNMANLMISFLSLKNAAWHEIVACQHNQPSWNVHGWKDSLFTTYLSWQLVIRSFFYVRSGKVAFIADVSINHFSSHAACDRLRFRLL